MTTCRKIFTFSWPLYRRFFLILPLLKRATLNFSQIKGISVLVWMSSPAGRAFHNCCFRKNIFPTPPTQPTPPNSYGQYHSPLKSHNHRLCISSDGNCRGPADLLIELRWQRRKSDWERSCCCCVPDQTSTEALARFVCSHIKAFPLSSCHSLLIYPLTTTHYPVSLSQS